MMSSRVDCDSKEVKCRLMKSSGYSKLRACDLLAYQGS